MKTVTTALIALVLLGCKHDKIVTPALPVITLNTPSQNQHFAMGETINITGTITSVLPLSEVGVHMTDKATDNEFFHNHYGAGSVTSYSFNATYVITNNTTTRFEVEIEAVDIDGNTSLEEIEILIN